MCWMKSGTRIACTHQLPDPYEKVLVRLDHWSGVDIYLAFYDPKRGWCDCKRKFWLTEVTDND